MECNRADRGQQVPEAPHRRTGAEGGLGSSAVTRAYCGIEPDGEDAHQETPHGEHGKRTAAHLSAERGHGHLHVFGKNRAIQTNSKTLMITPATSPPRITRFQLIFPIACSFGWKLVDCTARPWLTEA